MHFIDGVGSLGLQLNPWKFLLLLLVIFSFAHAAFSFFKVLKSNESDISKNWGPLEAVTISISVYFSAQLIAGLLISIIPLINRSTSEKSIDSIQNNVWATFAFILLIEAITISLIFLFIRRRNVKFIDLGLNKTKFKYIGFAFAGFGVYFLLYVLGLAISKALIPGLNLDQKQEIGFNTSTTGISLIPVFLSLVILPPITEEIVARGFLFGGLRSKLPFLLSAVITSVLFASAHLGAAKDGLLWVAAIDTFTLSLVLCYLREKTGSLWPSIGLHAMKNGIAFIVLFNITQYFR